MTEDAQADATQRPASTADASMGIPPAGVGVGSQEPVGQALRDPVSAAPAAQAAEVPEEVRRVRERAAEIARKAREAGLPPEGVSRALRTGRDPSVDVDDPTRVPSLNPNFAGVTDEQTAKERAAQLQVAVPIPGHPDGHYARPNGSVGPYQPL